MSNLAKDLALWKVARSKSIIDHYGSSRATEDGIKALRAAVVEDCKRLLGAHIATLEQDKTRGIAAAGIAMEALEKAKAALDSLKK